MSYSSTQEADSISFLVVAAAWGGQTKGGRLL